MDKKHYDLHLCYAVPHGKIFQIHFEIYYKSFGKGIVLNFKKEAVVSSMLTIVKKNIIFTCHKVVRPQVVGEMCKFQKTCCQISSGCCMPNIMKIYHYLVTLLQKQKG